MGCDIHGWVEVKKDYLDWWIGIIKIDWIADRNYTMFACLANVRNYDNVKPISEPKGIPKDVSDEAKEDIEGWGVDGHSHTWLTWKEIKEYDWYNNKYYEHRVIEFTKDGIKKVKPEWKSMKEAISSGWQLLFDLMERLAKEYGDENVRLVIWFDN